MAEQMSESTGSRLARAALDEGMTITDYTKRYLTFQSNVMEFRYDKQKEVLQSRGMLTPDQPWKLSELSMIMRAFFRLEPVERAMLSRLALVWHEEDMTTEDEG